MKKKLLILVTAIMFVLVGCGSKPTLSDWVNSKDVTDAEDAANKQYAEAKITVDIYAEGEDILVYSMVYDKDTYAALADMAQSEIDDYFNGQIDTLSTGMLPLIDECKESLGIDLKAVRVEYILDGKVLWTHDFSK